MSMSTSIFSHPLRVDIRSMFPNHLMPWAFTKDMILHLSYSLSFVLIFRCICSSIILFAFFFSIFQWLLFLIYIVPRIRTHITVGYFHSFVLLETYFKNDLRHQSFDSLSLFVFIRYYLELFYCSLSGLAYGGIL